MIHRVSNPIDYARVDSADVVRKKFRRRLIWFLAVTFVVMVIGVRWIQFGEIVLTGPARSNPLGLPMRYQAKPTYTYVNQTIGVDFRAFGLPGYPKWHVAIRYRTLFILATIPWLITLIRLIRVWRRKRPADTGGNL